MSFPVVLPYCTDLDDGTDDIFEDLGTNIGLGSSSGKIITVIIFGLLSLNDKGWCSLQLMAYFYFTGTSIRKRKQYSDDTKRAVYAMLLEGSVQGHLPEGVSLHVSLAMDVSLRCVQRIWNEGQKGGGIQAVVNKRVGHCGRKRIELPMEAITAIPFQENMDAKIVPST